MISEDMEIGRTVRLLVIALLLLAAGCTSDEPGLVGTGLPINTNLPELQTKVFKDISFYKGLKVIDEDVPFSANEVLYLGAAAGRASSILARYDFQAVIDTFATRSAVPLAYEDIKEINLRIIRTTAYVSAGEKTEKSEKQYVVYDLEDELDVDLYPGAEPAYDPGVVGRWAGLNDLVKISLSKLAFLDWVNGDHKGIIIRDEGSPEDDLIGYAAKELTHYSELETIGEFTVVGPTITVVFASGYNLGAITLQPIDDTSTLHTVMDSPSLATDGLLMRTHSRRYPGFAFDLGDLPGGVLVNRAVLRIGVNHLTSYGPLTSLVLATLPRALIADNGTLTLRQMKDNADLLIGQTSVDVSLLNDETGYWLGFDVTNFMQREVNGVLADEPYCFMLAGGEKFFGAYNTSRNPDFYLSVFDFYGQGDPEYPPILEVIYTPFAGGGK